MCSTVFMSAVFLVGVFRKPELMQWFMRSRVQLMKAPGSMQGKKISSWKPWTYPGKKWFLIMMLFWPVSIMVICNKGCCHSSPELHWKKQCVKGQRTPYCPLSCPNVRRGTLHGQEELLTHQPGKSPHAVAFRRPYNFPYCFLT